ncbi:MAG TPA: EVE domain-containing protein [Tepidisphaeraceae bacterium]|jgi:predicted RNA-binding protein with PUA-like domain|nr:EVE domain-containing protein [Tepidisphaeraceae bacterium]
MNRWLLKTEPSVYSFDDLSAAKSATWDGVANALALKHMREMKKGDEVFIYHTGDEKAVVGIAKVTGAPYPDPKADDEKLTVIDLKPVKRLAKPVRLATVKADKAFAGWALISNSRLSAMPVPPAMWERVLELATA